MDPLRQSQVPRPRPTAKNVADDPPAIVPEIAGGLDTSVSRQSRVTRPTAKLIDGNNHEKPALTFQRAAVAAEIARVATEAIQANPSQSTPSPSPQPTVSSLELSATSHDPSPSTSNPTQEERSKSIRGKNKRNIIVSSDDSEDEPEDNVAAKKTKTTLNSVICKY